MNLPELREARDETAVAYLNLRDKMSNETHRRLEEARKKINEDIHREFGIELELAFKAKNEAYTACQKAEVEAAAAQAPFPVGTKLVGWSHSKYAGYNAKREATALGVLEVYSNSTKAQHNARRKFHLEPGKYIVRLLKKDGTPGLLIEPYGRGGKYIWLPEGQTPVEGQ